MGETLPIGEHYLGMANVRMFGCSRRTIERRMHDCGLSVRGFYTLISDTDLREVIGSIARIQPNLGAKALDGALRAQGIIVQRSRIRESLYDVDPEGVERRRTRVLHRRSYQVESPNALWHVDSHHKLIRWKIVVHGVTPPLQLLEHTFTAHTSISRVQAVMGQDW